MTSSRSPHKEDKPRVRFAPSPTGFLHIGGARTALFNWLFARRENGTFILRIEDTDKVRSEKKFEDDILDCFRWLDIDWDEGPDVEGPFGPYRQSDRLDIYERYLETMLKDGTAYHCFCTKEDLERDRESLLTQGLPPRYSGKCKNLSKKEAEERIHSGIPSVIRVKTPEKAVVFQDMIRGDVRFEPAVLEDFIIAKDTRSPLYNFAATIDDYEMKISHVIRGEEHLSNTPRQIIIQHVLGLTTPHYAHLPLILNPDRSKLSKRFADTALHDYRTKGYLPEAIVNFMVLLGWHPTTERELFTKEELAEIFDLPRVQKAGAIFNQEKLDWINKQYIRKLLPNNLLAKLKESSQLLKNATLPDETIMKIINLEKDRMSTLTDFGLSSDFFFTMPEYQKEMLAWKNSTFETTKDNLRAVREVLNPISQKMFTAKNTQQSLEPLTAQRGRGEVLWPLRVALSGKKQSPPPYEILEILGKDESLKRIDYAIQKL